MTYRIFVLLLLSLVLSACRGASNRVPIPTPQPAPTANASGGFDAYRPLPTLPPQSGFIILLTADG